jgi:predicted transcriptional regulator
MRTTLTLDDDVAARLERLRKNRNASFKELVNEALRQGLRSLETSPVRREPFTTRTVDLGQCSLGNVDDVAEVLAVTEGDSYR